jgi:NADH-quinone oxidoreductase subunit C
MSEPTPKPHAAPAPPPKPAGRPIEEILADPAVAAVAAAQRDAIVAAKEFAGEITLTVKREKIHEVCAAFKSDSYTYLVDLSGIDYSKYPGHSGERFAVAYLLYSFEKNKRIRLKVFTIDAAAIPTVSNVWKTANWHEREVFDMFGIRFDGHPNLERILMWEGFNGHPLRKDFPVRGIDTGACIYPEVFPEGGGPKEGSTGKEPKDVNLWKGPIIPYGRAPLERLAATPVSKAELAKRVAETAHPTPQAPWHDPAMQLDARMDLAEGRDLKSRLFAAMKQTDCTACGWDCEGYAMAIAAGETSDVTLCIPGDPETEETLRELMEEAGKPHN